MDKLFWEISVWDSTRRIKQLHIPYGRITEGKLEELLRTLTAKYALRDEEIVHRFQKRKTKGYLMLLEAHRSYNPIAYECGINPYSYARIIKIDSTK
jgi:hypothetical protein